MKPDATYEDMRPEGARDARAVPDVDQDDDAALVRASQRGDGEAFAALVRRHGPSVLSVTIRMLGRGGDAEDAAQDTLVAAYKALPGFALDATFSTWLYRIAVNKCRDRLRARRPDPIAIDATGEGRWPAIELPGDRTPHSLLEQIELAGELERAVQALPPIYRESFVLRHVEGLSYDDMSAILGAHRDTIKMRVYKARALLCRTLAHLAGRV